LEIGSGPGRLLMVAKLSNLLNCHRYAGFDLNNETVLLGQKALGLEDELFVANALEFDYSEFDVMFSYRPIRVPEMQIALEKRIVETMKPGAYLMAPLSEDLARYPELRCVNKPLATWRKSVPDGDS
ncbi:MAG: class I SAM-dependent methyltransferase, partial [Pseudomonadota bacterium]